MIITVESTSITSFSKISNPAAELAQLQFMSDAVQVPDFNFTEPLDCYEYVNNQIQLKADWEAIKEGIEAEAAGQVQNEQGVYVPQSLTARQARLALHNIGKLADVPAAIAALPEPQKTNAEIEWEYATHIERSNPFVDVLADALQLTDEQIDQLFVEGVKL